MEEQLEKYLRGELEENERVVLEQELEKSPELFEQLRIEYGLQKGFDKIRAERMKDRFQEIDDQTKVILINYKTYLKWAAVILIILTPVFFLMNRGSSGMDIYTEYYTQYPNVLEPVTRSEESVNLGLMAYEKGDFETAATFFSEELESVEDPDIRFYLALSQLAVNNFNDARQNLKAAIDSKDSGFTDQAIWYLALLEIRTSNTNTAKSHLTDLSDSDSYGKRAKEVLEKL